VSQTTKLKQNILHKDCSTGVQEALSTDCSLYI